MSKLAVVAIGGNSLIKDKNHQTVPDQYQAVAETVSHLANLIEHGYEMVITHGNGPQIGFILLRSELSKYYIHTVPVDSCGADTQGSIGYNIQMAMDNEFKRRGITKKVVTVITQVVVSKNDPAFLNPTKPIGPFYDQHEAERYRRERKWDIAEDAGRGWRRVIPSPKPLKIIEIDAIKNLLKNRFVVIAAGGGGIPVIEENKMLKGVEAVIDKDYATSLLASRLKADLFLISTAVETVYLNFNKPDQTPLLRTTSSEAEKYLKAGHFAKGSMAPKIQAILDYLRKGGKEALITTPQAIDRALRGETGTRITP
ncbi:carbamate kinase [bacterium]|nr:carbamate kinase [bacterium]